MSDVISDPAQAPMGRPPAAQIDLAELDDKHLWRYRHPNERAGAGSDLRRDWRQL